MKPMTSVMTWMRSAALLGAIMASLTFALAEVEVRTYDNSESVAPGQVKFRNLLCVVNSYIFYDRSLINTEKHLMGIYGIRQAVKLIHFCNASLKPARGPVHRRLYVRAVCQCRRTFVKSHGNGGSEV